MTEPSAPTGETNPTRNTRGVSLHPGGLTIGDQFVPLLSGSVHYFRLDPRDWKPCLEACKATGARLIDVYIPWAIHEVAPGSFDFGRLHAHNDVAAFLRIAHELGLYVIARPGPHINAELSFFGIPERIVWDPHCQARSRTNSPVMLPMLPVAFPVPSYASDAFHDETARYFRALAQVLAPCLHPQGPVVMLQIDNEAALYFRDSAYDQDYHPDALRLYRDFLRDKYKTFEALEAAYPASALTTPDPNANGETKPAFTFATVAPPKQFDAKSPAELAWHLDWCAFHEHLVSHALARFAKSLEDAGLSGLPTSHNLPMGQEASPLNVARITKAIDLVGLDYYYPAGPQTRAVIERRTTELAVRCEALQKPPFACEMGAGFPPFFPPLDENDSAFTILTSLAYGLRGLNVYMMVERDRWIGAPIDPHGRTRPFARFFQKLFSALGATDFFNLRRRVPVRILMPRSERRLARATHAFGPLAGTIFSVLGAGARECCFEDDLGLGYAPAVLADTFARALEIALSARGVPFAYVGGEDREVSLDGAKWIVCACSGGLSAALFDKLKAAHQKGTRISIGPCAPVFDGSMKLLDLPYDIEQLRDAESCVPVLIEDDPAAADAAVASAVMAYQLPTYACDPTGIYATVHEDTEGRPRVLFVINPGSHDTVARVTLHTQEPRAVDVLDGASFGRSRESFEVRMMPKSVRMLALSK